MGEESAFGGQRRRELVGIADQRSCHPLQDDGSVVAAHAPEGRSDFNRAGNRALHSLVGQRLSSAVEKSLGEPFRVRDRHISSIDPGTPVTA